METLDCKKICTSPDEECTLSQKGMCCDFCDNKLWCEFPCQNNHNDCGGYKEKEKEK